MNKKNNWLSIFLFAGIIFIFTNTLLAAPTILTPSDGVVIDDQTPDLSWNDNNASYFQVQISDDSNFSNLVCNDDHVNSFNYTPGDQYCHSLDEGTYWWRVRTYSDSWSDWSSRSFTIFLSNLNPQVSVNPSEGSNGTTFDQSGSGFTPNSSATLYFNTPDGQSTVNESTDSNGSYSHSWICNNCPAGNYEYWAVDDSTGISSNTVSFSITNEIADPNVHSLHGTLTLNNLPDNVNSTVTLYAQDLSGTYPQTSTVVDSNGNYSLAVFEGTYRVYCKVYVWFYTNNNEYYNYSYDDYDIDTNMSVSSDTIFNIVVPTVLLSGSVTDTNGTPVSGARITNYTDYGGVCVTSGLDGNYKALVMPGTYTITVQPPSNSGFAAISKTIQVSGNTVENIVKSGWPKIISTIAENEIHTISEEIVNQVNDSGLITNMSENTKINGNIIRDIMAGTVSNLLKDQIENGTGFLVNNVIL